MWRLIYELAGIAGVDPGPLTLRELLWMVEGKGRDHWAHTSALMALLANCHRDPKKNRPFKPRDFNPYMRTRREPPVARIKDLSILKRVFVDRSAPKTESGSKPQPEPPSERTRP